MSVVPRIEKAKLPARLAGAERRGDERRVGQHPQMETQPGSGFVGRDEGREGLLRGMQTGEAAGGPGRGCLWAMTDGLQSVSRSLSVIYDVEVGIEALGVFIKALGPAL